MGRESSGVGGSAVHNCVGSLSRAAVRVWVSLKPTNSYDLLCAEFYFRVFRCRVRCRNANVRFASVGLEVRASHDYQPRLATLCEPRLLQFAAILYAIGAVGKAAVS